jgi:hypothetical protein
MWKSLPSLSVSILKIVCGQQQHIDILFVVKDRRPVRQGWSTILKEKNIAKLSYIEKKCIFAAQNQPL